MQPPYEALIADRRVNRPAGTHERADAGSERRFVERSDLAPLLRPVHGQLSIITALG
jgi:hypothetical protein